MDIAAKNTHFVAARATARAEQSIRLTFSRTENPTRKPWQDSYNSRRDTCPLQAGPTRSGPSVRGRKADNFEEQIEWDVRLDRRVVRKNVARRHADVRQPSDQIESG
jgi:hypothetical protein